MDEFAAARKEWVGKRVRITDPESEFFGYCGTVQTIAFDEIGFADYARVKVDTYPELTYYQSLFKAIDLDWVK